MVELEVGYGRSPREAFLWMKHVPPELQHKSEKEDGSRSLFLEMQKWSFAQASSVQKLH
jgi:hypothetical protein